MTSMMNDTIDGAKNAVSSARHGTEQVVASGVRKFGDAVHAATALVAAARALGIDDALGWAGLQRRRSPLGSLAIFGAGLAVGAGGGAVFASVSGADLRRAFLEPLPGKAKDVAAKIEVEAKHLDDKVEDIA